jgi:transcriptional regulator with XRE-family HTH domain
MSLGDRIRTRLSAINMTQAALCRASGVPQSTLNSILQRDTRSSPHLIKLAAALRTTPAYLLGETDDPDSEIAEAALSFEERELIDVTRQLGREDFTVLTYIARRLVGGGLPGTPPAINDRRPTTIHDRQLGYKSG